MIHYAVSIEDHVARCAEEGRKLTAGQIAILHTLALDCCNHFAEQLVVFASYEHLARRTGLSVSGIKKHTVALKHAGCLRKGKSARGRGTEYTLLRPKHTSEDARRNPFQPSGAETAAEGAVEILRADGRVREVKAKKKAKPSPNPKVRPDMIAAALEDMAGFTPVFKPDRKGKPARKLALPYSPKTGDWSAVRTAQAFIGLRGLELFEKVCDAAKARGEFAPTKEARARLFEMPLVDELLAEVAPSKPAPKATVKVEPEQVAAPVAVQAPAASDEDRRIEQMLIDMLGMTHDVAVTTTQAIARHGYYADEVAIEIETFRADPAQRPIWLPAN